MTFETFLYYAVVFVGAFSITKTIMKLVLWLDAPQKK